MRLSTPSSPLARCVRACAQGSEELRLKREYNDMRAKAAPRLLAAAKAKAAAAAAGGSMSSSSSSAAAASQAASTPTAVLTGGEWYSQQAFRAYNQARLPYRPLHHAAIARSLASHSPLSALRPWARLPYSSPPDAHLSLARPLAS